MRSLALLVALATITGEARAGFVEFLSGTTGTVTLGSNGSLSGTVSLATVLGSNTPANAGLSQSVTNGTIAFSFAGPTSDGSGGFNYSSGTFSVLGQLPGFSYETLLSGSFPSGGDLNSAGGTPSLFQFTGGLGFFGATLANDVASLYGIPTTETGLFGLSFTQASPGGVASFKASEFMIQTSGSPAVPEPPSVLLAALGLMAVGWRAARKGR